jgi:hypothetical protein
MLWGRRGSDGRGGGRIRARSRLKGRRKGQAELLFFFLAPVPCCTRLSSSLGLFHHFLASPLSISPFLSHHYPPPSSATPSPPPTAPLASRLFRFAHPMIPTISACFQDSLTILAPSPHLPPARLSLPISHPSSGNPPPSAAQERRRLRREAHVGDQQMEAALSEQTWAGRTKRESDFRPLQTDWDGQANSGVK